MAPIAPAPSIDPRVDRGVPNVVRVIAAGGDEEGEGNGGEEKAHRARTVYSDFVRRSPPSASPVRVFVWALSLWLPMAACDVDPRDRLPASRGSAEPPGSPERGWGGLEVTLRGNERAACAVVLLHGYGAPADDLAPLGATLARSSGCLAVMPTAPEAAPGGGSGRQWWPLGEWRRRRASGEDLSGEIPPGMEDASRRIHGTLRTLEARGIEHGRVVLAGFSQGAMLALDAGLTAARPIGGIAALSGTLVARDRWRAAVERHGAPPLLLTHGRQDPVLAFARAERLRDLLDDGGAQVELVEFDGGHTIPPRARERLIQFVRERTAAPGARGAP